MLRPYSRGERYIELGIFLLQNKGDKAHILCENNAKKRYTLQAQLHSIVFDLGFRVKTKTLNPNLVIVERL